MTTTFKKTTLITGIAGIAGQDGAYLAEFLLKMGYEVHRVKRRASSFNTDRVDPHCIRLTEVETLLGDPTKDKEELGWVPRTTLKELVAEMVQADYTSAKRDALVKLAGFQTFDHHE